MKNEALRSSEVVYPKGTLFVTGGSHGIGEAILKEVGSGYQNTFCYDLSQSPDLDVTNPAILRREMDKTLVEGETQHDLVVSAGVIIAKPFLEQTPEEIAFQLRTNFEGAIYTIQAFLAWHRDNGHYVIPNIVVITSVSAHLHKSPEVAIYEASKAGLSHFVKSIVDPGRREFIINTIEPGTIRETEIGGWRPDGSFDKSAREEIEKAQAKEVDMLPVEVSKKDVASVAKMLLFDNQGGIFNGASLTVDGGYSVLKK